MNHTQSWAEFGERVVPAALPSLGTAPYFTITDCPLPCPDFFAKLTASCPTLPRALPFPRVELNSTADLKNYSRFLYYSRSTADSTSTADRL